jgi:hypothetical protein
MTQLATTTPEGRPQELLRSLGAHSYAEAYKSGRSLSAWLESKDPSADHKDRLDAFGRLLKVSGIRTRTIPEMGVFADKLEAFDQNENTRALLPEWVAREARRARTGKEPTTRALYVTGDNISGTAGQPIEFAQEPRFAQIAPAIPLNELVAMTTGINGGAYQAFYLNSDTDALRMKRVAEGTEVPKAKLTAGTHTVRLKKYGRALEISYEQLRRQPIDIVALHIARMAVQAESDKVAAVMDTAINGDGNASTSATVYNLTTLDPAASAGTLTLKGWLAFKMKFTNPYMMTVALANDAVILQTFLLNTGSANVPLVFIAGQNGFGGFRSINPGLRDNVGVGWTADAPSLKIVAFDSRFAIERVYEIGGNLTEVEMWISRQTKEIVMTEVEGYDVFDQAATKILNVNA